MDLPAGRVVSRRDQQPNRSSLNWDNPPQHLPPHVFDDVPTGLRKLGAYDSIPVDGRRPLKYLDTLVEPTS